MGAAAFVRAACLEKEWLQWLLVLLLFFL